LIGENIQRSKNVNVHLIEREGIRSPRLSVSSSKVNTKIDAQRNEKGTADRCKKIREEFMKIRASRPSYDRLEPRKPELVIPVQEGAGCPGTFHPQKQQ
jgi:hypothetical protein